MSAMVSGVTLGSFEHLPTHSRRCSFWVLDPASDARSVDLEFENEVWLSTIMLEWGSCGQMLSVNGETIGCALYCPPRAVPRSSTFPTSPVGHDAVLLTQLRIDSPDDADLHSATLIQAVVGDLVNRGVRAVEAFGIRHNADDAAPEARSAGAHQSCSAAKCMIDADFLEQVGFEVVAPHNRFPRLRLELDRDHGWKQDVESALEQLLIAAGISVVDIEQKSTVGAQ